MHCAIDRTLYVRSQTRACVRTHLRLFERRDPLHTHTFSTNAIERTYVRSIACVLNQHVTLSRSPSSFSSSFPLCAVQCLPLFLSSPITPNHHPTAQTPPQHLCTTAHHHRRPSHHPISSFLHFFSFFSHKPNLPQIPQFVPFLGIKRHNPSTDCAFCIFLCGFSLLQEVGLGF